MRKKHENIRELFIEELKDMYDGEQQILKALPDVIKSAESEELKEAVQQHFKETENQVRRLHTIFGKLKMTHGRKTCQAVKGLIEECKEVIKEFPMSALRDAAMISKAQRIEHYEISAYGTLRALAKELELDDIADLLNETLDEESNADKTLTKVAEGSLLTTGVNHKANM